MTNIIGGFTIQKDPTEAFQNYYAVDSRPEALVKNCIFPRSTWQEPPGAQQRPGSELPVFQ
jgi:hypothetical protein